MLCFNPCFDGSGSEMVKNINMTIKIASFNPCFDGSGSEIKSLVWFESFPVKFQSLF